MTERTGGRRPPRVDVDLSKPDHVHPAEEPELDAQLEVVVEALRKLAVTGRKRGRSAQELEGQPAKRVRGALNLTRFVTARDVRDALQCSRATAYRHLRRAAGRGMYERGILRVSVDNWEQYAAEEFGCGSTSEATFGGQSSTTNTAVGSGSRPGARTRKPRVMSRVNSNEPPQIRTAQPKTKPRSDER